MVGEQFTSPVIPATPGARCQTPTSRSALGKGSGLINTPSTTLKIAVVAPMPSANVISATAVKAGAFPSRRKTNGSALMQTHTTEGPLRFARNLWIIWWDLRAGRRLACRAEPFEGFLQQRRDLGRFAPLNVAAMQHIDRF